MTERLRILLRDWLLRPSKEELAALDAAKNALAESAKVFEAQIQEINRNQERLVKSICHEIARHPQTTGTRQ